MPTPLIGYAEMFTDRILLAITVELLKLVLRIESNIQVPKYFIVNVKWCMP